MPTLRRILVPVDFQEGSRAALVYAAFLAEPFHASIDVLHVWEPPHLVGADLLLHGSASPGGQTLAQFARTHAGHEMEHFLSAIERRGTIRVRGRLESGNVPRTIVQLAAETPYDLIVMGTHGRRGLERILLGSVAERVVRLAPCPVITLRATEDRPETEGPKEAKPWEDDPSRPSFRQT
jgi:nucleotide-binding universal stress UspA family protein